LPSGSARTCEQPLQLGVAVGGADVDVQAELPGPRVYVTVDDPITVSRTNRLPVLDSDTLFDCSNKAVDSLDMGAKVGANMCSSQASPSDVWRTLSQLDGSSGDTGRRPATG
jgi:hypothetical protein